MSANTPLQNKPRSVFQKTIRHPWRRFLLRLRHILRWILLALLIGILVGLIGTAFVYCIEYVTDFRLEHPFIMLGLPAAGLLIIWLYRITRNHDDRGTNMVIAALRSEAELPAQMAPLIFISTALTHLFGGSAGREGAALQLGGSIGNQLARWFRLRRLDKRILILAGMSAAFSAIFRTPAAAVVFVMEVGYIGAMHYAAIFPCALASLTAYYVAERLGLGLSHYTVTDIPTLTPVTGVLTLLLGILCALLSTVFCIVLHRTEHLMEKKLPNPYLRIVVAAVILLLFGLLFQSYDYFGVGAHMITGAIAGETVWYAFLAKMLFTAVTLGGGFKGGEIVPTFFVGAAFGCLFGQITGLSPSLCAAAGMIATFCGVTNCPLASLFIAAELFGMESMPFCLLTVAVSYLLSGYHGLYREQRFLYSKFTDAQVHHKTRH